MRSILVILTVLICFATTGKCVDPYCQPSQTQPVNKPPPLLPKKKFSLGIEQVVPNFFSVPFLEEYYDSEINEFALILHSMGVEAKTIVRFDTAQIFDINEVDDKCQTTKCDMDDDSDTFCLTELENNLPELVNLNITNHEIFISSQLFGIGEGFNTVYMGFDILDGVRVERWDVCTKMSEGDFDVLWANRSIYWTADEVTTPLGIPSPLQVIMTVSNDNIETTYTSTVAWYKPDIPDDFKPFEVPKHLFCPDWKTEIPFPGKPMPSKQFQFRTQVVERNTADISWTEEWYDFEGGYFRIDHEVKNAEDGNNLVVSQVVDLNEDITYAMMSSPNGLHSCSVESLETAVFDLQGSAADLTSLFASLASYRQRETRSEGSLENVKRKFSKKTLPDFFGTRNTNYTFDGKKNIRAFETLVWKGIKNFTLGPYSYETLWLWNFAESYSQLSGITVVPVQREIIVRNSSNNVSMEALGKGDRIVHQISGFRYLKPPEMDTNSVFDISNCFLDVFDAKPVHLAFRIGVLNLKLNLSLFQFQFLAAMRSKISQAAKVGLLRVAQLKGRLSSFNEIWLEFNILPIYPDMPKKFTSKTEVTSLKDAQTNLKKAIDVGELQLSWKVPGSATEISLKAVKNSLRNTTQGSLIPVTPPPTTTVTSTKIPSVSTKIPSVSTESYEKLFSAGSVAGVAVGCWFGGFLVFSGITYFIFPSLKRYLSAP